MTGSRRAVARATLVAVLLMAGGCGKGRRSPATIDLTAVVATAERQPEHGAFDVRAEILDGQRRPVIAVPAASRVTWRLTLPAHARLSMWLSARSHCASPPVDFRVGISDGRVYEQLLARQIAPGASPLGWELAAIDLSRYGGFQWSLFYRPSEISWSLIFNTRPAAAVGCVAEPMWGAPTVGTTS